MCVFPYIFISLMSPSVFRKIRLFPQTIILIFLPKSVLILWSDWRHSTLLLLIKTECDLPDGGLISLHFIYNAAASAPIHAFLEFFSSVLSKIFFPSHWLLSHMNIFETMNSNNRGINPLPTTVINSRKQYWPNQQSNHQPPVLTSCTLQIERATGLGTGRCETIIKLLYTTCRLVPNHHCQMLFNPSPGDKILDWSKMEEIADDILKCIKNEKISAIYGRKHCEKRRNCLLQAIFSFSHNVFHSYISLVRQTAALSGNGGKALSENQL